MATPSFGCSVRDFIAAIQLIVKISSALKETSSALAKFNSIYQELQQLKLMLEQLRGLPNDALNAIRGIALTVKRLLEEFVENIGSIKGLYRVMATGTE
jgi:hypothetical protein